MASFVQVLFLLTISTTVFLPAQFFTGTSAGDVHALLRGTLALTLHALSRSLWVRVACVGRVQAVHLSYVGFSE